MNRNTREENEAPKKSAKMKQLINKIREEIEGNFSLFFCAQKAKQKFFSYLIEKKSVGFRCLVVK